MDRYEAQVTSTLFSLGSGLLELRYPDDLTEITALLLPWAAAGQGGEINTRLIVRDSYIDSFVVCSSVNGGAETTELSGVERGQLPQALFDLAANFTEKSVLLSASAACWRDVGAIVASPAGDSGDGFFAWLLSRGFDDVRDPPQGAESRRSAAADRDGFVLLPPRVTRSPEELGEAGFVSAASRDGVEVKAASDVEGRPTRCGLIVFPSLAPGKSRAEIEPMDASQAAFELMRRVRNVPFARGGALPTISALARATPAIAIRYSALEQLEGVADALLKFLLDQGLTHEAVARFLPAINPPQEPEPAVVAPAAPAAQAKYPIPDATPSRGPAKLTIGMATYDDYDGVYFSLQALRMYHPEVMDRVELLVIDNHPDGPCSRSLKDLDGWLPNYRYIPEPLLNGTSQSRNRVFAEAAGEIVLCMDCHVFIEPGALRRLIAYFDANPETRDLVQGPLVADDLKNISTHFKASWGAGMFGQWDRDARGENPDNDPFEIPMQGLGLFACRRQAWLGFHKDFRGFGGEEGYIHEKYRQHGARALCLPFLRWLHRFARPMGVPYPLPWEDRIRNYVIGRNELGMPIDDVEAHFTELLGADVVKRQIEKVQAELNAVRQAPA